MLKKYAKLAEIVNILDEYYTGNFPDFFSARAIHPSAELKKEKILHDNLWGTNNFNFLELALIDTPILQRLRHIHQTGLAYHVYMSAHHTRFEHSLGVAIISSKIFDKIFERQHDKFRDIVLAITDDPDVHSYYRKKRQELRIAGLLHDTGHSMFSHTSEKVYSQIHLIKEAALELTELTGKKKGEGEVLSFCISQTNCLRRYVDSIFDRYKTDTVVGEYKNLDWNNISLMIVGRSIHPYLQFMGDIISSGFDADKLDYLLRDAVSAGLPLRYDFERYMSSVLIKDFFEPDDEERLQNLYSEVFKGKDIVRREDTSTKFFGYIVYRLRLPRKAMNTIEQIVMCKLMLFSYIYHHAKVRAAEGLLARLLKLELEEMVGRGESDKQLLINFLSMTDCSLHDGNMFITPKINEEYKRRIIYRLLPREIFSIGAVCVSPDQEDILKQFKVSLADTDQKDQIISKIEEIIGNELLRVNSSLGKNYQEAILKAGVLVDVPSLPSIKEIEEIIVESEGDPSKIAFKKLFPIGAWTDAYNHYRHAVRIFAFSEYYEMVLKAAERALREIVGISSDDFYQAIMRRREHLLTVN